MFKSTHDLSFEVSEWKLATYVDDFKKFNIGTCEGLFRYFNGNYEMLMVKNHQKHNGHIRDVFEWFEHLCIEKEAGLFLTEFMNTNYKEYLLTKGFTEYKNGVIKFFN